MVLGSVLPFGAQILLIPFCYIPLGIISNRGGGRGKNSYDGSNGTQEAVSSPFSRRWFVMCIGVKIIQQIYSLFNRQIRKIFI